MNKKKPNYKEIKKKNVDAIDNIDYNVCVYMKQLENNYSELFKKHPSITNMILDVYYPQFYRNEIKQIKNKYPNKKYHTALMAGPFDHFVNLS